MIDDEDEEEIGALASASDSEFLVAVERYLTTDPTPADHRVFRDPRIAQRTLEAVEVLVARVTEQLEDPPPRMVGDRSYEVATRRYRARLVGVRRTLKPIVGLIRDRDRALDPDKPRQRALESLAQDHPKEFTAYRKKFEAEAAARARRYETQIRRLQLGGAPDED
jgi:hypothetical protein